MFGLGTRCRAGYSQGSDVPEESCKPGKTNSTLWPFPAGSGEKGTLNTAFKDLVAVYTVKSFFFASLVQNFVRAITALGWYFEQYEGDYKRAVELWEWADSLGCGEAAVNLGILLSQGLYPGEPANKVRKRSSGSQFNPLRTFAFYIIHPQKTILSKPPVVNSYNITEYEFSGQASAHNSVNNIT